MRAVISNWLLISVVLTAPLSGCAFGNPGYNGDVNFVGEMEVEDGGFVMDGEIVNDGMERFRDVSVYLYFSNGTAFNSTSVGDLNGVLPITIHSTTIPKHVVIHSPDFWNTSRVQLNYYTRNESDGYEPTTISQRGGLPVELD